MLNKKTNVLFLLLLFLQGIVFAQSEGKYDNQGKKQGLWVETAERNDQYAQITKTDSGWYEHGVKTGAWTESSRYPRSHTRFTGMYNLGRRNGWWLNYNADYVWHDSTLYLVQKILYRNDTIMETYSFAATDVDSWEQKRHWQVYSHHYLSAGGDTTFFVEYYTKTKADSGKLFKEIYWTTYGKLNALPDRRPVNTLHSHEQWYWEHGGGWANDSIYLENKVTHKRWLRDGKLFVENTVTGPFGPREPRTERDTLPRSYYYFENGIKHVLPEPDSTHPVIRTSMFFSQLDSTTSFSRTELIGNTRYMKGYDTWHERVISTMESVYDGGDPKGSRISYFPTGEIKNKVVFFKGETYDTTYYSNGKPASARYSSYREGSENINKTYYPNGQLKTVDRGTYGKYIHEEYDELGKLTLRKVY